MGSVEKIKEQIRSELSFREIVVPSNMANGWGFGYFLTSRQHKYKEKLNMKTSLTSSCSYPTGKKYRQLVVMQKRSLQDADAL